MDAESQKFARKEPGYRACDLFVQKVLDGEQIGLAVEFVNAEFQASWTDALFLRSLKAGAANRPNYKRAIDAITNSFQES